MSVSAERVGKLLKIGRATFLLAADLKKKSPWLTAKEAMESAKNVLADTQTVLHQNPTPASLDERQSDHGKS